MHVALIMRLSVQWPRCVGYRAGGRAGTSGSLRVAADTLGLPLVTSKALLGNREARVAPRAAGGIREVPHTSLSVARFDLGHIREKSIYDFS